MSFYYSIVTYYNFNKIGKIKIHSNDSGKLLAFEIPKNDFKYFDSNHENVDFISDSQNKAAIYFLYNPHQQKIYIGKTHNINERLNQHKRNPEKDDFFIKTLFIVGDKSFNLTEEIIDYLEWYYIDKTKKQNFWQIGNNIMRNREPSISSYLKTKIQGYINEIDNYLELVDINLTSIKQTIQSKNQDVFKLKHAYMVVDNNGFKVLKGSKIVSLDWIKNKEDTNNKFVTLKTLTPIILNLEQNNLIEPDLNDNKYLILKSDIIVDNVSTFTKLACGYYGKVSEDIVLETNPNINLKTYLNN